MFEHTNITIRRLLTEGTDKRLRELERRWKASGNVRDHLAYLKGSVRSGDTIEMVGLDDPRTILPEFHLKDMTYDGNSLNNLVSRIESVLEDRITPWVRKVKVKITAIKWANPTPPGATDNFQFLCDIKLSSPTLRRMDPRARSGPYTYSWDEQNAYGGDAAAITMRYNFSTIGALEGLFSARPAPWSADGDEGALRRFRSTYNTGIVVYSTISSIPKG